MYVRVVEHGSLAVLRNNTSNRGNTESGLTEPDILSKKMKDWITAYRDDIDLQQIIDWLQKEYKCCGVQGKQI